MTPENEVNGLGWELDWADQDSGSLWRFLYERLLQL